MPSWPGLVRHPCPKLSNHLCNQDQALALGQRSFPTARHHNTTVISKQVRCTCMYVHTVYCSNVDLWFTHRETTIGAGCGATAAWATRRRDRATPRGGRAAHCEVPWGEICPEAVTEVLLLVGGVGGRTIWHDRQRALRRHQTKLLSLLPVLSVVV